MAARAGHGSKPKLRTDCGLLFLGLENNRTIVVTFSFASPAFYIGKKYIEDFKRAPLKMRNLSSRVERIKYISLKYFFPPEGD